MRLQTSLTHALSHLQIRLLLFFGQCRHLILVLRRQIHLPQFSQEMFSLGTLLIDISSMNI